MDRCAQKRDAAVALLQRYLGTPSAVAVRGLHPPHRPVPTPPRPHFTLQRKVARFKAKEAFRDSIAEIERDGIDIKYSNSHARRNLPDFDALAA